jgi:hypothetical protein
MSEDNKEFPRTTDVRVLEGTPNVNPHVLKLATDVVDRNVRELKEQELVTQFDELAKDHMHSEQLKLLANLVTKSKELEPAIKSALGQTLEKMQRSTRIL